MPEITMALELAMVQDVNEADNENRLENATIPITVPQVVPTPSRRPSALNELEPEFIELANVMREGLLIHTSGRLLFANPAMATMLGYADVAAFIAAISLTQHIAPHERERLDDYQFNRLSGKPAPKRYEAELRDTEGRAVYVDISATLIYWQEKTAVMVTCVDITEQKRAEQVRQASVDQFRHLVEGSLQGIIIHRDWRPLFINDAAVRIFGFPSRQKLEELRSLDDLFASWHHQFLSDYMEARLRDQAEPQQLQIQCIGFVGNVMDVDISLRPVEWNGQRAIQTTIVDITEREKARQALERSQKEARKLSEQLLQSQELERARIARDLHDSVSQQITRIECDLYRYLDKLPARQKTLRQAIEGDVSQRLGSINDELHRIYNNLRPPILDDFGLVKAISWCCQQAEELRPGMTVRQELTLKPEDIKDTLMIPMFRIAQEALINAAKHSGASLVTVHLYQSDRAYILRVDDDGCGIKPKDPNQEIQGFGLISMRERAQFSGGELEIVSRYKQGCSISALWPKYPGMNVR